jgi:hypothetical protein
MRIHNVHSRELVAPVERAWDLVAGLASEHDVLWRSRLTHTFDSRVGWKLLPVHRMLLAAHDPLLEDLLDNAERATGGSPAPRPPLPRLLRVADAVEGGLIRLRRNWLVSA